MPKTSSASLSGRPPPSISVNTKVRPMRPRKRPLLTAVAMGRMKGTTVR